MKRVLLYAPRVLPPSQTFVADQARVLTRWSPTLVGRERLDDGLELSDLLAPEMQTAAARPARAQQALQMVTRRVPLLRAVAERQPPDLVHAHFLTGGYDVLSSLRPPPCPVVVTAHGFDATWFGSPNETLRPEQWMNGLLRRRLVRRPIQLIAVSRFIRDRLVELGAPEQRIVVHHTGVDTTYFTPPPAGVDRRGILFVGRLVTKKGVLDLLHAVVRLRSGGINVPVEIIGDGPDRAAVETFVERERLDVTLWGVRPREFVADAMRRAAVQCNPSRTAPSGDREGFGMVLAEAQATGLPVVATTSGGMVDAVDHGRTGLLVEEGDHVGLAEALRKCLTDTVLRQRLSEAARPWVLEHFDLHRQTAVLEDRYDEWASETS